MKVSTNAVNGMVDRNIDDEGPMTKYFALRHDQTLDAVFGGSLPTSMAQTITDEMQDCATKGHPIGSTFDIYEVTFKRIKRIKKVASIKELPIG